MRPGAPGNFNRPGRLAQSARALRSHRRGRGFEPLIAHPAQRTRHLVPGSSCLQAEDEPCELSSARLPWSRCPDCANGQDVRRSRTSPTASTGWPGRCGSTDATTMSTGPAHCAAATPTPWWFLSVGCSTIDAIPYRVCSGHPVMRPGRNVGLVGEPRPRARSETQPFISCASILQPFRRPRRLLTPMTRATPRHRTRSSSSRTRPRGFLGSTPPTTSTGSSMREGHCCHEHSPAVARLARVAEREP